MTPYINLSRNKVCGLATTGPLYSSPVIYMSFPWQVNPMYDWSEVVGCVRRVEKEQHEGIFLQSCSLD